MQIFKRNRLPQTFPLLVSHSAFRQIGNDRMKRGTVRPVSALPGIRPGDLLWATDNQGSCTLLVVSRVECLTWQEIDDQHRIICGFNSAATFATKYTTAFGDVFPDDPVVLVRWDSGNPPSC